MNFRNLRRGSIFSNNSEIWWWWLFGVGNLIIGGRFVFLFTGNSFYITNDSEANRSVEGEDAVTLAVPVTEVSSGIEQQPSNQHQLPLLFQDQQRNDADPTHKKTDSKYSSGNPPAEVSGLAHGWYSILGLTCLQVTGTHVKWSSNGNSWHNNLSLV